MTSKRLGAQNMMTVKKGNCGIDDRKREKKKKRKTRGDLEEK